MSDRGRAEADTTAGTRACGDTETRSLVCAPTRPPSRAYSRVACYVFNFDSTPPCAKPRPRLCRRRGGPARSVRAAVL
eukprot:4039914-Lingulodinium_polyedra.AAC.1